MTALRPLQSPTPRPRLRRRPRRSVPTTPERREGGGPARTCIGCRRRALATALVRVVLSADGNLVVGRSLPGRGAWLCAATAAGCAKAAQHRKAFERALRAPVRADAVTALVERLGADGRTMRDCSVAGLTAPPGDS